MKLLTIIPHYNNTKGLYKSIKSIHDFDILIVDDGSNERINEQKVRGLISNPNTDVFFIYLKNNCGIEIALNKGLEFALEKCYDFISRLDCGDVNINNRLKKQINTLINNEDLFLLGSWCDFVDINGNYQFTVKPPKDYSVIKKKMFLNSMFIHPTVMFKASIIKSIGMYPLNYKRAEDYAYFFKIISKFRSENYPEVLVQIENNESGISIKNRKEQIRSRLLVIIDNFKFGLYPLYGLIRNLILYLLPFKLTLLLKLLIKSKK